MPFPRRKRSKSTAPDNTWLRRQFPKQLFVSMLQRLSLGRRNLATKFPSHRSSEKAATHTDATMNAPTIDSHTCLCQGALPRKDMGVDGIYQSPVEIED